MGDLGNVKQNLDLQAVETNVGDTLQDTETFETINEYTVVLDSTEDDSNFEGDVIVEREQWANQYEFLCSLVSMSVGLGDVWRFPIVASANGGGAFLIPYVLVLVFIGTPIYFLELALGQFASKTQLQVWECCPILKGIGISAMLSTICVLTYYTSLLSVITVYFIESFFPTLPWTVCPAGTNCSNVSPAEAHLVKDVLHQRVNIDDGIGSPDWKLTLCLLLAWITIGVILVKGVKSSGKVAYFTAIFPFVILLTMLVRGVTLKGAGTGILKFITPDFWILVKPQVWYRAMCQAFFSLNTCFGSIIMFASYNPFRHNIFRDVFILTATDTLASIIAGITVFSVAGYLSETSGKPLDEILSAGESGIAFIMYPTAIAQFPWPNFFAAAFFLMLLVLVLGSSAPDAGALIAIISDKYPRVDRWKITVGVCSSAFLLGLIYVTEGGQFMLTLVDAFGASLSIFLVAILEILGIAYIYKLKNFISDVEFMLQRKLGWYWKICWYAVIPAVLAFVLGYSLIFDLFAHPITYNGVAYPVSALVCGWLLASACLAPLVICAVQEVTKARSTTILEKLKEASKPRKSWGPRNPVIRAEWNEFKRRHGRT